MSNGSEELAATIEELMIAVGRGVGQAQTELDRSSIAMQKSIDVDAALTQHGIVATWYQMPRTEMEIRVALSFQGTRGTATTPSKLQKVYMQAVNARYQNLFRFEAQASSVVRMAIVPVPPRVSDATQPPARMTQATAVEAALPHLVKEAGTNTPRRDAQITASFNSVTRTWNVLQFTEVRGETTTLAVVDVNDQTGVATKR